MKKIRRLLSIILSLLLIVSTMPTTIAAVLEKERELAQQAMVESGYAVTNVGDINEDGTIDVQDYQELINKIIADDHEQIETEGYDDIIRYDLNGDGYLDALDAHLMNLVIKGLATFDVYVVGDYDCNGVAFDEFDLIAIKHAVTNSDKLSTSQKYASDINGDGKLSEEDLTELNAIYGEVSSAACEDNVKVYYSWGNNYSTCTATAMCELCNKTLSAQTVDTTSEMLTKAIRI